MILVLLAACTSGDDTGKTTDPFDGTFALTDANNYSYTSAITAESTQVELQQDIFFDWSGLTTDLLGHAVDAATDVDTVWVIQFPFLTQDEVLDAIVTDTLLQQDIGPYIQFRNSDVDATSGHLSEFVFPPDNAIDPAADFTDGSGTWLVRATTGANDTRMLGFMEPTTETTNTTFVLGDTSATLDFDADLQSLDAFAFDEELGTYTVDWSGLTTHANGNDIDLGLLDQLLVARYDGMTLDDLEDQFIDVELIASQTYTADVYGLTSVDLSAAVDADGNAFSGFGTDTLWLLALQCTACTNPAPPFLTVVQVGG